MVWLKINHNLGDAMDICKVGGYDLPGWRGWFLAGARRRIPTMVDGVNATAAALLLRTWTSLCWLYALFIFLLKYHTCKDAGGLRLTPIVDAGLVHLGEGTGASLAIVMIILQMAINTYKELYSVVACMRDFITAWNFWRECAFFKTDRLAWRRFFAQCARIFPW